MESSLLVLLFVKNLSFTCVITIKNLNGSIEASVIS